MKKFFIISIQLILLLVLSLLITSNSFTISVEINDLIYSVSSTFIFIVLIIFFAFIFILQTSYFKTRFKLHKYKNNKIIKKKEAGLNSFIDGMIALANKDYKKAIYLSKNISKNLDHNPSLSLLLKSEIYKVEKKSSDLQKVYEEMIKNNNTAILGYRGLMEQYLKEHDFHHAYIYGEKLFNINPHVEKIYETLVNIIAKTQHWQQLITITDKALSKKIINKSTYQENKAIAFFEIAKIKKDSDREDSIHFIEKAIKLKKNFPPFLDLYINLLIENKKYDFAKKILRRAWSDSPHLDYKSNIISLSNNLGISFLDLADYIVGSNDSKEVSKLLLVEAAISNNKWKEARNQIKDLLDVQPKKEICLLMARIEEGDSNDIQKVNSWKLRAKNGEMSNLWVCSITNKSQNQWSSLSNSGYFNSLVWKQPIMLNQLIIE